MTRLVFYTPMLINWNERPTVARGGGTGSSFSPVCSKRGQVVSWLGIEIIYLMYAQKGPPTGASSGVHGYPPACSRTNFILGRVSTDTRTINRTETEQFSPRRYFFRSPPVLATPDLNEESVRSIKRRLQHRPWVMEMRSIPSTGFALCFCAVNWF